MAHAAFLLEEEAHHRDPLAQPSEPRGVGGRLLRVQLGFEPTDWKPMTSVGTGVKEIRIHADTACRVLYIAKLEEAVYVLHAFVKKSRTTAKHDIDLAKERLRQLIEARGKR
mgnify:CR=1 FL=1